MSGAVATYDALRHLADSWGLVAMAVMFVVCIGWTFLPRASAAHRRAAMMILNDEGTTHG